MIELALQSTSRRHNFKQFAIVLGHNATSKRSQSRQFRRNRRSVRHLHPNADAILNAVTKNLDLWGHRYSVDSLLIRKKNCRPEVFPRELTPKTHSGILSYLTARTRMRFTCSILSRVLELMRSDKRASSRT